MTLSAYTGFGLLFDKTNHEEFVSTFSIIMRFFYNNLDSHHSDITQDKLLLYLSDSIQYINSNSSYNSSSSNIDSIFCYIDLSIKNSLHLMISKGYPVVVRFLLENKFFHVNQQYLGVSPLERAIKVVEARLKNEMVTNYEFDHPSSDVTNGMLLQTIAVILTFAPDHSEISRLGSTDLSKDVDNEFKKIRRYQGHSNLSVLFNTFRMCAVQRTPATLTKLDSVLQSWNLGYLVTNHTKFHQLQGLPFVFWFAGLILGRGQVNTFLLNQLSLNYHDWAVELRKDEQILEFLRKCYKILFDNLHRTPNNNPYNNASLLHYFICIPDLKLCRLALIHSPELIHKRDLYGNTPLHCAFMLSLENKIYKKTICDLVGDDYVMHFFNFDKYNSKGQTLLHLVSERGTETDEIVRDLGDLFANYIHHKIAKNRHLKIDLSIQDNEKWSPLLQLCYKNDPLALEYATFAHQQVIEMQHTQPNKAYTCLHFAARFKNLSICKLLLNEKKYRAQHISSRDLISHRAAEILYISGFNNSVKNSDKIDERSKKTTSVKSDSTNSNSNANHNDNNNDNDNNKEIKPDINNEFVTVESCIDDTDYKSFSNGVIKNSGSFTKRLRPNSPLLFNGKTKSAAIESNNRFYSTKVSSKLSYHQNSNNSNNNNNNNRSLTPTILPTNNNNNNTTTKPSEFKSSTDNPFLKRLTRHKQQDLDYKHVEVENLYFLSASPLTEAIILKSFELFNLIVSHSKLICSDACKSLKFALELELNFKNYILPLLSNVVGMAKTRRYRKDADLQKRLHMDLHDGYLNTWCLIQILEYMSQEDFVFDDCRRLPEHLKKNFQELSFDDVISFDLSTNVIDRIPDSLLNLNAITSLTLNSNDITEIPHFQGSCPLLSLKEINLNHNRIKNKIPMWLLKHDKLEKLLLVDNELDFMEDEHWGNSILSQTRLREIQLNKNRVSFIPRYIKHLKSLNELNFAENSIGTVPLEIWYCYKLQILDLSNNSIKLIEYPSNNCPNKEVEVSETGNQNTIVEGTTTTDEYCHLRELKLTKNELKSAPNGLICVAPKLNKLLVKENSDIEKLDLRYCPKFLKNLDYSECKLREVIYSETIAVPCFASEDRRKQDGLCSHLRTLHEPFNFLTELHLNNNISLETVALGKADNKENLYFPSLKSLSLQKNALKELTPHIGYQKCLEILDISDNLTLKRLPKELGNLKIYKKLQQFKKDNCNIENIHKDASLPVILNTLRAEGMDCETNRRFKLAVVGFQRRGKTTLLRVLQDKKYKSVESTEGIDIDTWELASPENKNEKIKFETWDFAGEQDYYPTHHCFLSPRSVYLLVFRACDRQKGINELDGWLKSLEMMASGCPVLLVGTHIDEIEQESLQNLAQEILSKYHPEKGPFPMIADICFITSNPGIMVSNKDQIRSLKKAIFEVASHLHVGNSSTSVQYNPKALKDHPNAFINQRIPLLYNQIERKIKEFAVQLGRDEKPPFVLEEELFRFCKQNFKQDNDVLYDCLEYLNHLGVILHFDTDRLKDIYFLNSQWLSSSLGILIRDHHPTNSKLDNRLITSSRRHNNEAIIQSYQEAEIEKSLKLALKEGGIVNTVILQTYLKNKNKMLHQWMDNYLELLEKFEVLLRIDSTSILVPSHLPKEVSLEKSVMCTANIDLSNLSPNQINTSMFLIERMWFLDHIPYGFWARFISRLRGEQLISNTFNPNNNNSSIAFLLSKKNFIIQYKNRPILELTHDESSNSNRHDKVPGLIKHNFFIHLKINLLIWSVLCRDQQGGIIEFQSSRIYHKDILNKVREIIPNVALLLHKISEHYKILNTNWYRNMANFASNENLKHDPLAFYIPCTRCMIPTQNEDGANEDDANKEIGSTDPYLQLHIYKGENKVICFNSKTCIFLHFGKGNSAPKCNLHGSISFETVCPDLAFKHMYSEDESKQVEIKSDEILGIGGFGLVTKGVFQLNGQPHDVALKFLVKSPEEKAENFHHFLFKVEGYQESELLEMHSTLLTEMSFCVGLKHENVVKLIKIGFEVYFFLMFEFAPLGSLKNVLEKYAETECHLPYKIILQTLRGICTGLTYLHEELKIIHMDMKPDNILVWEYPFPNERRYVAENGNVSVKIGDYGLAYIYTAMENKLKYPMGTHGYMAQEVLMSNGSIFPNSDMYAFGIILFQLLTGSLSPADQADIVHFAQRQHNFPVIFYKMVLKSVEFTPSKRASSSQMLKWLNSTEMDRIQLQLAIDLGEFVSIFSTYYSEISFKSETNRREYSKLPLRSDIQKRQLSYIEIMKGEMNEFRQQKTKPFPTPEFKCSKELSLDYKDISQKDLITRKMIKISNQRYTSSQSTYKNMSKASHFASYYTSSIFSNVSKEDPNELIGKHLVDDDNKCSFKCDYSCQICVSFDKPLPVLTANTITKNPRLLTMLSFNNQNDGSIKQFDSTDEVFNARINAMCIVKDAIWLGFDKGEIRVYANLKEIQSGRTSSPIYSGTLGNQSDANGPPMNIYDLKYLEEWMCVVVATSFGEIYFIYEDFHKKCKFCLVCKINPSFQTISVNRLVIVRACGAIQLWCTRGEIKNPLSVVYLAGTPDKPFCTIQHPNDARYVDQPMKEITTTPYDSFHVWTATINRSYIFCWSTQTCSFEGRICIDNTKSTNNRMLNAPVVKSLLAVGEKLYVGTNRGCIYTYNCVTREPIAVFQWFIGPVRHIILFPPDIEVCLNRNAYFPINVANVNQKCDDETRAKSLLLGALGEGLHVLKNGDTEKEIPTPDYAKNHMIFALWRDLDCDLYSDQFDDFHSISISNTAVTNSTDVYCSTSSD